MSGTILTNTPAVADAAIQVQNASQQTELNRQKSLSIVANNAENYGGRGSDAFHSAINMVNNHYDQHQQAILQTGRALSAANDGMTETDGAMAAQYGT